LLQRFDYFQELAVCLGADIISSGEIRCRFGASEELRQFGKFFEQLQTSTFQPYFGIWEVGQTEPIKVMITRKTVKDMTHHTQFFMQSLEIPISDKRIETTIVLCLKDGGELIPISGFPRVLIVDESLKCWCY
jgi:hypothetical protein